MQEPVGTLIRQLRRLHNMTQTELGGNAFSKSYVSAIESNKLNPSKEALRHFAIRLGKPEDYFQIILDARRTGNEALLPQTEDLARQPDAVSLLAHEKVALLAAFLDQSEYTEIQAPETFFTLSPEMLALLALPDQAHYYFFQGVMLQKKQNHLSAIETLEQALARESHAEHHAAILYELSKCYLQLNLPQTAFHYAVRAQASASQQRAVFTSSTLPFQIELLNGQISLALGLYQQALAYFEQAQLHLNAQQSMRYAGQLYWGLGYCSYALAFQHASAPSVESGRIELLCQRALAYLLQSQTIAQIAGDVQESRLRRLALARLQLDWSIWYRQTSSQERPGDHSSQGLLVAKASSLLDEAGEQCHQVLASLQGGRTADADAREQQEGFFLALALLIRVEVQRALTAHEQGYENTFQRSRSFASYLCQQALDACKEKDLIESIVWNVGKLASVAAAASFSALPRLPEIAPEEQEEMSWPTRVSLAEVYFAAGEVAEMLGRTATMPDFSSDCYAKSDLCFLRTLKAFSFAHAHSQHDPGHLSRAYQRYTVLIEERLRENRDLEQTTAQAANALLALCKQQFLLVSEQPSISRVASLERRPAGVKMTY